MKRQDLSPICTLFYSMDPEIEVDAIKKLLYMSVLLTFI